MNTESFERNVPVCHRRLKRPLLWCYRCGTVCDPEPLDFVHGIPHRRRFLDFFGSRCSNPSLRSTLFGRNRKRETGVKVYPCDMSVAINWVTEVYVAYIYTERKMRLPVMDFMFRNVIKQPEAIFSS